jgi:hypothetical protein
MEVISLCSLPVGALLWSTEQRGWSLSVVCKATFRLTPDELELAGDQIPIHRADRHWDDKSTASAYAPSDLAPFKPKVDVVVVGHAYAPGRLPRASLTARLSLGEIDKQLVVKGARVRDAQGEVGPAASFKRMPLRYERALASRSDDNPAGVPAEGRPDPDGAAFLPNIEPSPGQNVVEPIGFGPIAASWPARARRLGRHSEYWSHTEWYERELPRELDFGYFNVAPLDQQVEVLSTGERILLENLHPEHPRLITHLPALKPVAYVERANAEPELLTLRCDTLWIDTAELACTLTWRGQLRLSGPRESARCLVALSESGENMSWEQVERLRTSCDVPPWFDRGPESMGGAIGLGRSTAVEAVTGRQLHVTMVAGPIIEPAPRSMEGVFLSSRDVELVESDPNPNTADAAPWSERDRASLTKLLWFAEDQLETIGNEPAWRGLLSGQAPLRDPRQAGRRIINSVLEHGEVAQASAIESSLVAASAHDPFVAPLVLGAGVLEPSLDVVARLRATVTSITPFVGNDGALRSLLADARELLSLTWLDTADGIAEELIARLVEAFERVGRNLPPDFVDAQTTRILVQERRFRERELWSQQWIRCKFTPVDVRGAIPAYLPIEARGRLPLDAKIDAKLIATVDVREDAYETHPLCLRIAALARVVP